jgi:SAM-dependent methyltransferase
MKREELERLYDDRYAATYDAKFLQAPSALAHVRFELDVVRSLLPRGARWLDVACGTGYFLRAFPDVDRAGIDVSPAMLARAREANAGVELRRHDFRDPIPEWAGRFTLVSCMWYAYSYVESMNEFERFVANLATWTAPDGVCFVPVGDPELIARTRLPDDIATPLWPGETRITGLTWSYTEDGKVHSLLAPTVPYVTERFARFFEDVTIVDYPATEPRRALIARNKRDVLDTAIRSGAS